MNACFVLRRPIDFSKSKLGHADYSHCEVPVGIGEIRLRGSMSVEISEDEDDDGNSAALPIKSGDAIESIRCAGSEGKGVHYFAAAQRFVRSSSGSFRGGGIHGKHKRRAPSRSVSSEASPNARYRYLLIHHERLGTVGDDAHHRSPVVDVCNSVFSKTVLMCGAQIAPRPAQDALGWMFSSVTG